MFLKKFFVSAAAVAVFALQAAPAVAQYQSTTPSPSITTSEPPTTLSVQPSIQRRGGLSTTGADVAAFALIGAGTFATGSMLVFAGRRRREDS